jgi:hypothetical protein
MLSSLESLISSDFWTDLIAAAFKALAIAIPLILVFWAVLKIRLARMKKEMRGLKAYTEAIESRLQLARDLNVGEANTLAELRGEIDALRQLIPAKRVRIQRKPREGTNDDKPAVEAADKPSIAEVALEEAGVSR